jgi:hypothetical protein
MLVRHLHRPPIIGFDLCCMRAVFETLALTPCYPMFLYHSLQQYKSVPKKVFVLPIVLAFPSAKSPFVS